MPLSDATLDELLLSVAEHHTQILRQLREAIQSGDAEREHALACVACGLSNQNEITRAAAADGAGSLEISSRAAKRGKWSRE
jgi:hypothetical protein